VRYPEIATLVSHSAVGTLTLSFAISARVDKNQQRCVREQVSEHVRTLLALEGETPDALAVAFESHESTSFVRISRDVRTFGREELQLLVAVLADRFGAQLIKSQTSDDEPLDDDDAPADELVEYAIEAMRDPGQQRSMVGFREEKRVLVYFVKSSKKAKARARS